MKGMDLFFGRIAHPEESINSANHLSSADEREGQGVMGPGGHSPTFSCPRPLHRTRARIPIKNRGRASLSCSSSPDTRSSPSSFLKSKSLDTIERIALSFGLEHRRYAPHRFRLELHALRHQAGADTAMYHCLQHRLLLTSLLASLPGGWALSTFRSQDDISLTEITVSLRRQGGSCPDNRPGNSDRAPRLSPLPM